MKVYAHKSEKLKDHKPKREGTGEEREMHWEFWRSTDGGLEYSAGPNQHTYGWQNSKDVPCKIPISWIFNQTLIKVLLWRGSADELKVQISQLLDMKNIL